MADEPVYQHAFQRSGPVPTFEAVQSRLLLSKAFTQDLATYYAERAAVEDLYVKSLQKLAGKLHGVSSPALLGAVESLNLSPQEENRQLGAWKALRARVEAEATDTAKLHEAWTKKVNEQVAAPLKSSTTKGEWAKWTTLEQSLGAIARDYDQTLDKVQKAQQKGNTKSSKSNQSKLLSSQSHLSQLGSTLTSSLPAFLTASQSLDLSHAAFVKQALARYGEISSDLGGERTEQGGRLLVGVVELDEASEMQGWALREGERTASRGGGSNGAGSTAAYLNEFGQTSARPSAASARTESIAEETPGQMLPPPVPSARQRLASSPRPAPPPAAPLALPTEAPSSSGSKFGGGKLKGLFKRDRAGSGTAGSSKYGTLQLGQSHSSRVDVSRPSDRHSIDSRDSESIAGPEEPTGLSAPAFNRSVSAASSTMGNMPPPIQPDAPKPKKRDSLMPFSNGGSLFRRKSTMNPSPMSSPAFDRSEPILSESPVNNAPANQVDDEGYSVPPAGYDRQAGTTSNLMDASDDDEAADGLGVMGQQPKLPTVALAPATITETEEDRAAALARVQSALLSSPPSIGSLNSSLGGGLGAPPSASLARRTTRGRRDGRMSTYQPNSTDDMPLAKVVEQHQAQNGGMSPSFSPPISPNLGSSSPSAFRSTDRANSMLSTLSGSTASRALAGHKDPFEGVTSPGLRASIVETVNVLSKGGEVSRVMITGEIALSHKLAPGASSADPVKIRISNFDQFEKAAPNAAYISPLADSPGEYTVSPSLAAHGATTTVLKYQLRVAPGQEGFFVPLQVKAAWKCEPTLTRVIVTYEPNPSAVFAGRASSAESSPFGDDDGAQELPSLEDVGFLLPMSVPVSTFQAKPAASWSAEKSRLAFSIEPIALSGAQGEAKLLASLNTEQSAAPQPVAVRWKVAGRTVSAVGLESVGGEQVEEVKRTTVSGKYLVA